MHLFLHHCMGVDIQKWTEKGGTDGEIHIHLSETILFWCMRTDTQKMKTTKIKKQNWVGSGKLVVQEGGPISPAYIRTRRLPNAISWTTTTQLPPAPISHYSGCFPILPFFVTPLLSDDNNDTVSGLICPHGFRSSHSGWQRCGRRTWNRMRSHLHYGQFQHTEPIRRFF